MPQVAHLGKSRPSGPCRVLKLCKKANMKRHIAFWRLLILLTVPLTGFSPQAVMPGGMGAAAAIPDAAEQALMPATGGMGAAVAADRFAAARAAAPGPVWRSQCVDCPKLLDAMTSRSLALDAQGYPHIVYGGDHLYYAWRDGVGWHFETVDGAAGVGAYASLALDAGGRVHVAYYDSRRRDLKYAEQTATGWAIAAVESVGDVGLSAVLALDGAARPYIAYYDDTHSAVKLARWNGSAWIIRPVEQLPGVARDISLAVDDAGHAHVVYYDLTDGDLRYARPRGDAWLPEIVDGEGTVGSDK